MAIGGFGDIMRAQPELFRSFFVCTGITFEQVERVLRFGDCPTSIHARTCSPEIEGLMRHYLKSLDMDQLTKFVVAISGSRYLPERITVGGSVYLPG